MDFVVTSGNQGLYDDEARALGANVFYLRFGRSNLASFVRGWRQLLQRGNYAALHDHQEYISGWHFLAGVGGCLPPVRISHVHNPIMALKVNYGASIARRLTAQTGRRLVDLFATNVCGTSGEVLRICGYELGRSRRPPVSVVHCGFSVDKFNGAREPDRDSVLREFNWPLDSKIVLSVGRLDRALDFNDPHNHKNSWFALNVVRVAAARHSSVRYLLAGAGDVTRSAMEHHIQKWGLTDRLRLIGVRNDIPRLMRAADVLLFPSVEEGLGMVAVEAQAAGLPVLASSAIPTECIVVPELYISMVLSESLETWATTLLEVATMERPSLELCRRAIANSGFAIENSAARLMEIYSSATP
jgi:glycosyltransferase EpsF